VADVGTQFQPWNGYLIFFFWILGNRAGVPIPATPALLLAGALSGFGELRLGMVLLLAIVATVLSDSLWFELGRRYGTRVLALLCRITFLPPTFVNRAERIIHRHGMPSLLVTKFIPGMNRTTLPLTGITQTSYLKFLVFDVVGAALWAAAYLVLGYVLRNELEAAARYAHHAGWLCATLAVLGAVGIWIIWSYLQRRRAPAEPATPGEQVVG